MLFPDLKPSREFTSYPFWSQVPWPDVAVKSKDVTLATLAAIQGFCRSKNIQLLIVALPFEEQVYSREVTGAGFDVRLPQMYVEEFAAANAIPYYDLLPELRS